MSLPAEFGELERAFRWMLSRAQLIASKGADVYKRQCWGCLATSEMDSETPEGSKPHPEAHRALVIILIVMAVFIITPFVVYLLAGHGAPPRP